LLGGLDMSYPEAPVFEENPLVVALFRHILPISHRRLRRVVHQFLGFAIGKKSNESSILIKALRNTIARCMRKRGIRYLLSPGRILHGQSRDPTILAALHPAKHLIKTLPSSPSARLRLASLSACAGHRRYTRSQAS